MPCIYTICIHTLPSASMRSSSDVHAYFMQRPHQFLLIRPSTPAVTCSAIPYSASSDLHLCYAAPACPADAFMLQLMHLCYQLMHLCYLHLCYAAPACPADGGPGVAYDGLTNTAATAVPAYFFDSETSTWPQSLSKDFLPGGAQRGLTNTEVGFLPPCSYAHDMAVAGRHPASICAPRAFARSKPPA